MYTEKDLKEMTVKKTIKLRNDISAVVEVHYFELLRYGGLAGIEECELSNITIKNNKKLVLKNGSMGMLSRITYEATQNNPMYGGYSKFYENLDKNEVVTRVNDIYLKGDFKELIERTVDELSKEIHEKLGVETEYSKKIDEKKKRIERAKKIVKQAEAQKEIPAKVEALKAQGAYNKVVNEGDEGYLPPMPIYKELYEQELEFLESAEALEYDNSL
jgi:hypothetical protein